MIKLNKEALEFFLEKMVVDRDWYKDALDRKESKILELTMHKNDLVYSVNSLRIRTAYVEELEVKLKELELEASLIPNLTTGPIGK